MRKIQISKRRDRAKWWHEPLPLDLRDRDIMRAKRITGGLQPGQSRRQRARRRA